MAGTDGHAVTPAAPAAPAAPADIPQRFESALTHD